MKTYILFLVLFSVIIIQAQNSLNISSGANITTLGNSIITLNNTELKNNGVFTDTNGTVQFKGDQDIDNNIIDGSGTTHFHDLIINNQVKLNKNIGVAGNLNLLSGGMVLNSGSVDLGNSGNIINETYINTISGTGGSILSNYKLNAPIKQNIGGQGVIITTTQNLEETIINRFNSNKTILGIDILRIYNINPTNNSNLNGTLAFTYVDEELNNSEDYLQVYESVDNGTTWVLINSIIDKTSNQISIQNLQSFNQYALVENDETLLNQVYNTNKLNIYKQGENLTFNYKGSNIKNITIYNVLGKIQLLQKNNTSLGTIIINTQNITAGMYVINIQLGNGTEILKKIIL